MVSYESCQTVGQQSELMGRIRCIKNQVKLLLCGFCDGKVVGASFAAMQPYRIECVVMNGIADGPNDKGLIRHR